MTETKQKKEPGMARLVIVLFLVAAIVAALLGVVNLFTAPVIALNQQRTKEEAMEAVLPADSYEQVDYTGADTTVMELYRAGDAGWVVQVAPTGFSGAITMMVGVNSDETISGVSITEHAETSGLGANATKPAFRDQFVGKSGTQAVTKDGGEIQALTGATITSRAVASGVNSALGAVAEASGGAPVQAASGASIPNG
ncbi:MAG: RnfABCDGE type electron transport complex subunit G [Oscillospiraceae bacterium]|nr:RnfABCDGE type electron transport complex subunit G [Oscillospiraceae bacterium]